MTSLTRQAFDSHNAINDVVKAYYKAAGGEDYVLKRRWENYQKEIPDMVHTEDVVSVSIEHTSDAAGRMVLTITNAAGRRTRFWCATNTGGLVRSIT